jgi:hypothetical protein
VEIDKVLLLLSVLLALAGAGAAVAAYLADRHQTYAAAVRRRRVQIAAVVCLVGAAISAATTGEVIGFGGATIWFMFATSQIPQIKGRRELDQIREVEAKERAARLDRETRATNELARSVGLPQIPLADERK